VICILGDMREEGYLVEREVGTVLLRLDERELHGDEQRCDGGRQARHGNLQQS